MPDVAHIGRPTDDDIRDRIKTMRQYGEAGWIPQMGAANYALNELHWCLGEELLEPYFTDENWPADKVRA